MNLRQNPAKYFWIYGEFQAFLLLPDHQKSWSPSSIPGTQEMSRKTSQLNDNPAYDSDNEGASQRNEDCSIQLTNLHARRLHYAPDSKDDMTNKVSSNMMLYKSAFYMPTFVSVCISCLLPIVQYTHVHMNGGGIFLHCTFINSPHGFHFPSINTL